MRLAQRRGEWKRAQCGRAVDRWSCEARHARAGEGAAAREMDGRAAADRPVWPGLRALGGRAPTREHASRTSVQRQRSEPKEAASSEGSRMRSMSPLHRTASSRPSSTAVRRLGLFAMALFAAPLE